MVVLYSILPLVINKGQKFENACNFLLIYTKQMNAYCVQKLQHQLLLMEPLQTWICSDRSVNQASIKFCCRLYFEYTGRVSNNQEGTHSSVTGYWVFAHHYKSYNFNLNLSIIPAWIW